jgi:hypothetical protein
VESASAIPGAAAFIAASSPQVRQAMAVQVPTRTETMRDVSVWRQFSTRISIAGASPAPISETDERARSTTVLCRFRDKNMVETPMIAVNGHSSSGCWRFSCTWPNKSHAVV